MSEIDSPVNSSEPRETGDILARALRRARWTRFCERLWPPLATLATAGGIFLAVSSLGVGEWGSSRGAALRSVRVAGPGGGRGRALDHHAVPRQDDRQGRPGPQPGHPPAPGSGDELGPGAPDRRRVVDGPAARLGGGPPLATARALGGRSRAPPRPA